MMGMVNLKKNQPKAQFSVDNGYETINHSKTNKTIEVYTKVNRDDDVKKVLKEYYTQYRQSTKGIESTPSK